MPQLVLLKPHTHAGKPGAIGDRIEVDAATAEWLLAHAVAVIAAVAQIDRVTQKVPPESRTSEDLQPHQPTHSNQRKEPKS